MRGAVSCFWTVTPKLATSGGSCGLDWITRICVRIRSVFGSVATSKFAVRRRDPSPALIEYM
jgi:hypothetical protein